MAPNGNEHYETHEYAGDRATDVYRVMTHMPDEDRSSRVELQDSITDSQASELSSDIRMGDDRVIGDVPNWNGFTSQQLYDFATRDNSPTTADALGRGFNDGGNRLAEAANGLFEAVTALEGAWSGVAADSARAALAPLAKAAGQTGQTAQMMGVQMSRQSVAATEVRKLPPPQEFDQQQALQAAITGGPAALQADLRAQKEAADAVKREQITYLNAYTQAMSAVDAQTPSFVPPPTRRINPEAGGNASVSGNLASIPGTGGGGGYPGGGYPGGGGGGSTGGTSTGSPTGGYVGAAPAAGSGSAFGPDGELLNPGDVTIPGTLPGTSASGFNPGTLPTSTPGPTTGIGGTPSAPAAGAGGFGGAFGNFGGAAAGGAGLGAGTGAGSGSGTGAGPRGGMGGPGGAAPGGAGAVGAGGGRGGAGGMAPGGRRANGEDDDEHERPAYLIEGDPDSTFGNDQLVAPAVIGDDGES